MTVRCACGEVYHADPSHEGKALRCGKCGAIVTIATPSVAAQSGSYLDRSDEPHIINTRKLRVRASLPVLAALASLAVLAYLSYWVFGRGTQPKQASLEPATQPIAAATPSPILPKPPACQDRSLPNGKEIGRARSFKGLGRFVVQNGTEMDADVKVVKENHILAWTYVSSHASHTIRNIAAGTYRLVVCQGTDWDTKARRFICSRSCFEFDKPFEFSETAEENGTRYGRHTVTLHEVEGGNVRKTPLSASAVDMLGTEGLAEGTPEKPRP